MTSIEGTAATRAVRVDGVLLDAQASQAVWNHSPDGFNWGYGGSGPSQLALAILLATGLGASRAFRLHHHFKREFLQAVPQGEDFRLDIDLADWLERAG